jgi:YHS domain-containing protein
VNAYLAIKHIYPDIKDDEFVLYDDGTGVIIYQWTSSLQQPSPAELEAAWELVEFDQAVADKKAELNIACKNAITGRFSADVDGVTYWFSNDTEAQSNFKDTKSLFDDGTIDAMAGGIVKWTAYDVNGNVCRIPLNKDQFKPVNIARVMHQNNNVSRLRDDLEPKVDAAKSVPDVQAITWDTP